MKCLIQTLGKTLINSIKNIKIQVSSSQVLDDIFKMVKWSKYGNKRNEHLRYANDIVLITDKKDEDNRRIR